MNKLTFTILLILGICNVTLSQNWNLGTTWIYETDEYGPPIYENHLILKVTSDTIVNNEQYAKLQAYKRNHITGELTTQDYSYILLQYVDQKIYLYDQTKHLIYDFSLDTGDSYLAYCDIEQSYFTVNIDSVGYVVHNATQRKVQYVSSENVSGCYFHGKIIEGVGFTEFILPRYTYVDPPPGGYLVCYNDSLFSYPDDTNCQEIIVSTKHLQEVKVKLYPNPIVSMIHIEGEVGSRYEIYNTMGKLAADDILNEQKRLLERYWIGWIRSCPT